MKGNKFEKEQPAHKTQQDMLVTQQVGTILFSPNHLSDI